MTDTASNATDTRDTDPNELTERPEDPARPDIIQVGPGAALKSGVGAFPMNEGSAPVADAEPSMGEILARGGFNVVGEEGVKLVPVATDAPLPPVKDPAIDIAKRVEMFGETAAMTVGELLFNPKAESIDPPIKLTELEQLQHQVATMESSWTEPRILKAALANATDTGAEAVADWIRTLESPTLKSILEGITAGAWKSQLAAPTIESYTPSAFCFRSQGMMGPYACERRIEPNKTNAACAKDVRRCGRCGFPIMHEKKE